MELSIECQEAIEKYILVKEKIVSFKYQNEEKILKSRHDNYLKMLEQITKGDKK